MAPKSKERELVRAMKKTRSLLTLLLLAMNVSCSREVAMDSGNTMAERFIPPAGFRRTACGDATFQNYVRTLPLKNAEAPVLYYNGEVKANSFHASVFDIPLLDSDLIQCADAVIKIRAEYLYSRTRYDDIEFTITNGMKVPFRRFMDGYRVSVDENATEWVDGFAKGKDRPIFDEYLAFIYAYAGTYSLSRELRKGSVDDIQIGDLFMDGGFPGHVVMVVDIAQNPETEKKVMLLAQGYMPSQEFHIIKSFSDISPWYYVTDDVLETPEWEFRKGSLMYFDEVYEQE